MSQAIAPTLARRPIVAPHVFWFWRILLLVYLSTNTLFAAWPDRFVWVFVWGLGRDNDVAEVTKVLDTAGQAGLNGAEVSFGLDTLCKHDADYFLRLEIVERVCQHNKLELIPSGKGWGHRDPPVVKLKVLSTRRKDELLRLLRRSRSSGAKNLPSSRRAQHLL